MTLKISQMDFQKNFGVWSETPRSFGSINLYFKNILYFICNYVEFMVYLSM